MSLIFRYEKNIFRSNFKNMVGQFLDDMLVKICAIFSLILINLMRRKLFYFYAFFLI